jgi:uncharacterized protein YceK
MKRIIFSVFVVLFVLSGCASDVETFQSTGTLGEQLDDLHKAYESHAINQSEYETAKEILIEHYK